MALSVAILYNIRMIGWYIGDEFERIWKKAILAQIMIPIRNLHEGIEENHRESLIRSTDFSTKIQADHLPNTNQACQFCAAVFRDGC
jgi:hypothetical protein